MSHNLNDLFEDIKITKADQNVYTITKNRKNHIDWKTLNVSGNREDDDKAFQQVRNSLAERNYYSNIVIPAITRNLVVDKEDIQDLEIALNEDTIVQIKSHKSYIQVTLFIPVYLPQIQTIYQLAPLPYQMDTKTQLYTEKLLPPSFTMKPDTHEIQGPKSSCALAVAKLESLEGKCPITFTRYQEIHKKI